MKRAKVWFKVYPDDYLWGTTKAELKPDERAVWIDFLCVATYKEGFVDITYPQSLASKFLIPLSLLNRCIKKFEKFGKIQIISEKKEKKLFAKITKWEKYQHSYLTSQGKRNKKNEVNDATLCDTDTMRNQGTDKIRLEEIRLEERRGEDNGLPPIPKNLPFKIQDEFKTMRAEIRDHRKDLALTDEELLRKYRLDRSEFEDKIKKLIATLTERIATYED